MATTNDSGRRQSKVVFDRVEPRSLPFGVKAFELPQGVDLAANEVRSLTWVYDTASDLVRWSSPLEELLGFEAGTPGFSVVTTGDVGDTDSGPAALSAVSSSSSALTLVQDEDDDEDDIGDRADGGSPAAGSEDCVQTHTGDTEFGDAVLAPIIEPIRRALPRPSST